MGGLAELSTLIVKRCLLPCCSVACDSMVTFGISNISEIPSFFARCTGCLETIHCRSWNHDGSMWMDIHAFCSHSLSLVATWRTGRALDLYCEKVLVSMLQCGL